MVRVSQFYRTAVELYYGIAAEEADFTYSSRDLFNLKTKLTPWIQRNYPDGTYMTYGGDDDEDRSYITVQLINRLGDEIELSKSQQDDLIAEVQNVLGDYPDYALLYPFKNRYEIFTDEGVIIPAWYVNSILPHIDYEGEIYYERGGNPLSENERYVVPLYPFMHADGVYIRTEDLKDMNDVYDKLVLKTTQRIIKMFEECYMINLPQEIITQWGFERVNYVETNPDRVGGKRQQNNVDLDPEEIDFLPQGPSILYRLTWSNLLVKQTYGSLVNFFNSLFMRANKKDKVRLLLEENYVVRHWLTYYLKTEYYDDKTFIPIFDGPSVYVQINSKEQLMQVVSLIRRAETVAYGNAMTMDVTRIAWGKVYQAVSINSNNNDCLYYYTESHDRPVTFSCLFGMSDNLNFYRQKMLTGGRDLISSLQQQLPTIRKQLIKNGENDIVVSKLDVFDMIEIDYIELI